MKFRAVAAAALALALGAGLTGCNLISPQRTTMEYAASDGVNAEVGDLQVRNALLVVDTDTEEVTEANLVLAVVTNSTEETKLEVVIDGGSTATIPVKKDAENKGLVAVGFGEAGPEPVTGKFTSGGTVTVTFRSGDAEATTKVPVLGAEDPANVLDEYETLAPGGGAAGESEAPANTKPAEQTPAETDEPAE